MVDLIGYNHWKGLQEVLVQVEIEFEEGKLELQVWMEWVQKESVEPHSME
jgi:hypothetical protein